MNLTRLKTLFAALPLVVPALLLTIPVHAQGPDSFGYTVTDRTPYNYADISSTGVSVLAGSDDRTATLNIGFNFTFYGAGYSSLCVSDNGLITFSGCDDSFTNLDLTSQSPAGNRPLIAPFWSDLSFAAPGAGAVYYQTLGSPGSRRFIIQWSAVYGLNGTTPYDFQVVLSEGDSSIRFQYLSISGGNPAQSRGASATVGIRGPGGEANGRRLQWSYNAPTLNDGLALVFTAPAALPPSGGPIFIPVPETLTVTPDAVRWSCPANGTPPSQLMRVVSSVGAASFTVTARQPWLVLAQTTGRLPGDFTMSMKDCKLPLGEYSSEVVFTSPAGATATVTVQLTVGPQPELFTTPAQLSFRRRVDEAVPAAQQLWVVARGQNTAYSLSSTTPWLDFEATPQRTARQVTISLKQPPTAPGVYQAVILATSPEASNSPLRIPITYEVTGPTAALTGTITNGASFTAGAVAPGSFATLFGVNLAEKRTLFESLPLPVELDGLTIRINGILCPLFMVDPIQLNFQVPYEAKPGESRLTVQRGNARIADITFDLREAAPGLAMNGRWAAALNQNWSVNGSDQPAPAGSVVSLFATGQGAVNGPVQTGAGATGPPWPEPLQPVTVRLAGQSVRVTFAGLAPGLVGALQVNIEIPASLGDGEYPVEVYVGDVVSNTGLLLVSKAPATP